MKNIELCPYSTNNLVAIAAFHILELPMEYSTSNKCSGAEMSRGGGAVVSVFQFSSSPIFVLNVYIARFFICSFLVGAVVERLIARKSAHAYLLYFLP